MSFIFVLFDFVPEPALKVEGNRYGYPLLVNGFNNQSKKKERRKTFYKEKKTDITGMPCWKSNPARYRSYPIAREKVNCFFYRTNC